MTFTLPIVGDSSGIWGTILNETLTDMEGRIVANTSASGTNSGNITTINGQITTINGRLTTLEGKPPGGIIIGTTGTLPAVTVGQITLATDTGYLSYGASIAGTPTRVPWPGSWIGTLTQTTAQNMPINTITKMAFDTATNDRLGGWTSATKSRYTCKLAGTYEFTGGASFDADKTGWRKTTILVGGVDVPGTTIVATPDSPPTGTATTVCSINFRPYIAKLAVGQYVEVGGMHTATVALTTFTSAVSYQPTLRVKYLGYDA